MKKVILSLVLSMFALAVSAADDWTKDTSKWYYVFKGKTAVIALMSGTTRIVKSDIGVYHAAVAGYLVDLKKNHYSKMVWSTPASNCIDGNGLLITLDADSGEMVSLDKYDFDGQKSLYSEIAFAICKYDVGGPPPKALKGPGLQKTT